MKYLLLLILLLPGCISLNVSMNTSAGDNNKPAIKTDSDQTPTTPISAAVPVAVGAQPNSSGTVNSK